jgi:uncharacterized protein (TIGR02246 family)
MTAAGLGLASAASAEDARAESCRRGDDVRVIEVLIPGEIGTACDVRVTRDGGARVNTPYNANADKNFCRAMAAELASELTLEGFECSTALSGSVEASLAGGSPAADPIEQKLTELSLDQQAEQLGVAKASSPETPAPQTDDAPLVMAPIANPEPEPVRATEPAPKPAAIADAAPSLEGIVEPDSVVETPVVLTAGAQPALTRAPRPVKNGAGRLVGAQPSLEDIIDVSTSATATAPELAGVRTLASKPTEDIIRGVMAANAAAWNEGNLPAFLGGYADSGDVRLLADGAVASGVSDVRKHYEAMVAAAGAMGRLSFTNLDVTLTAIDVATVVGRYAHESGPQKSAGAMTVVLKQIDGRWRIMQDTRVRDAMVPTLAPVN